MKQYTTKDQTAKLIELGFPKPTRIVAIGGFPPKDTLARYASYKDDFDSVTCYEGYSIGELIEFLCPRLHTTIYKLEIQKQKECSWDVEIMDVNENSLDYQMKQELIDALFNMCVILKEEGVI